MLHTSAAVPRRLLGAPPRRPPLSRKLAVALSRGVLAALLALGVLGGAFTACALPAFVNEALLHRDGARAKGTHLGVNGTHTSINEKPVFEHHFRYQHAGASYTSSSYSYDERAPWNGAVVVELVASRPATARIVGHRTTVLPLPGGVILAALVVAAFVLLVVAARRSFARLRLLAHGVEGRALLVDQWQKRSEGTVTGYELSYVFEDQRGRTQELHISTVDKRPLTDEQEEPILYDPMAPEQAALLDQLPGRPRIGPHGDFVDTARHLLPLRLLVVAASVAFLVLGLVLG